MSECTVPVVSSASQTNQSKNNDDPSLLRVVFIHLDWGIGGAEQLMLQLCTATQQQQQMKNRENSIVQMHLVTSYCNPQHCFELLHPTTGMFYKYLQVWGSWIPTHVFMNKGKAIMSTIRLLYLAFMVVHHPVMSTADLIVVDVLPTPLWILHYFCPNAALLFYCHFPDQLLIRNPKKSHSSGKLLYRSVLNTIEERSMTLADTITVNSKFTQQTVRETFPSMKDIDLPILYPALEIQENDTSNPTTKYTKRNDLIVSLNRYERKKNLGLLIEAMAWVQQQPDSPTKNKNIEVVIAGGYDKHNVENIEYRIELQQLAERLNVSITFKQSISDSERNELLHTALMVIYTPSFEHFGIVPLESMYAKTPVIACNNGGPIETIVHEHTGLLCHSTPESFGSAIRTLLQHPQRAIQMGLDGHDHVIQNFSPQQLQVQWGQLMNDTIVKGQERRQKQQDYSQSRSIYRVVSPRTLLYMVESMIVLLLCLCITYFLQSISILNRGQSMLSGIRGIFSNDEL